MSSPRVETLLQFARRTGGTTESDRFMRVNAELRSARMTKAAQRRRDRAWDELTQGIRATELAYADAIRKGEVIPPPPMTRIERLISTAAGHPDLLRVQAARRLLRRERDEGRYDGPIPEDTHDAGRTTLSPLPHGGPPCP